MLQLETIEHAYSFHSYNKQSARLIKPNYNIHSNQAIEDELVTFSTTFIVCKDRLEHQNLPAEFIGFNQSSIEKLLKYQADIYIVGSGSTPRFPDKVLLKTIAENKLPIEFMDTGAACRTFNILTGEYRNVTALIFFN